MRNIKTFQEFYLFESIPLADAKEFSSIKREKEAEERMNKLFKKLSSLPDARLSRNGNRIYIPFTEDAPQRSDYTIINMIKDALNGTKYSLYDYDDALVKDENGRLIKLNKALEKIGGNEDLIKKINTDATRMPSKKREKIIVFSKHPYDLAGMAQGRGWEQYSCMRFSQYGRDKIPCDIEEGTIIAYLTMPNDTNLQSPTARILIKPFTNVDNKNQIVYFPEARHYGTTSEKFKIAIENILEDINNGIVGSFTLNQKLYPDSGGSKIAFPKSKPVIREHVEFVLKSLNIQKYTIQKDLTVDVHQDVLIGQALSNLRIRFIPVKFGKIDGNFYCNSSELTSLDGCPVEVTGSFNCSNNNLKSLEGGPKIVKGNYGCFENKLTDLTGMAQEIGGSIYCGANNLQSLIGCPEIVNGDLNCLDSKLSSIKGAPKIIKGTFECGNNNLSQKDIEWATKNIKAEELIVDDL